MKVLIILSCLAAVCLALPNKRLSVRDVAETISRTAGMVNKNEIRKRSFDAIQYAFDLTDGNSDGHITASEFASYYVNNMPMFGLTTDEWISAFQATLPKVDDNGNGTLEVNEYRKLAQMGGYGK